MQYAYPRESTYAFGLSDLALVTALVEQDFLMVRRNKVCTAIAFGNMLLQRHVKVKGDI